FLTWTRTATLAGLVFSAGLLLMLFWRLTPRQRWMTLGGLGIGIVGILLAVTTFQLLPSFLEKSSLVDFSSGTGRLRVLWWGQSLQAFHERPWFGWGSDGQELALLKHADPEEWVWAGVDMYTDRAHNEYLDLLLTVGVVGWIVFSAFISNTVSRAWERTQRSSTSRMAVMLLCLILISHGVQSLASFATTSIWLLFWMTMAFLILLGHPQSAPDPLREWRRPLIWNMGGAVLMFAFFFFVLRVPLQERAVDQVEASSKIPVYEEVLAAVHADERAQPLLSWSAKNQLHRLTFLDYLADWLDPTLPISSSLTVRGEFRQRWPTVKEQSLRPIAENLTFAKYLVFLALEDPSVIPQMSEQFLATRKFSPFWAAPQQAWIAALNDVGQSDAALERIGQLEALLPDPYDDRILYDYLSLRLLNVYGFLNTERGRALEKKGETQSAERAYKLAATQLEKPQTAFDHLVQLAQAQGRGDEAQEWRALKSRWIQEDQALVVDLLEYRY
ncbi:MAG: O-antigen ligase family protein, partial [Patescibacteria group bacterium]